jgi:hypothetical protein
VSKYDRLATTAFHLRPDGIYRLQDGHWAMDFPRSWLEPITRRLRELTHKEHRSVPIVHLNRTIRALVPDVVAVGRNIDRKDYTGGWLYSTVRVDPARLEPILHAWIPTLDRNLDQAAVEELWSQLPMGDLEWRPLADEELGWPVVASGIAADTPAATAAIGALPAALFQLVPDVLAAALLRRSDRPPGFPHGFRRCPTTNGQGVELVSWPPLGMDPGEQGPYSFLVTLTIQTLPFVAEPRLNIEVGVRRWWPKAPASTGRNVNMYMLTAVPWLRGLHNSRSFHVAPTRWRSEGETWTLGWQARVAQILREVNLDRPLPDPAWVCGGPLTFLTEESGAALVYATSSRWPHEAPAGVSARDRDRILPWIRDGLDDVVEAVARFERVPFTVLGAKARESDAAVRRAAIARALLDGRTLRVDLLTDTGGVRDALFAEMVADLGLEIGQAEATDGGRCWETPELTVVLQERPIASLASELKLDGKRPKNRTERLERVRRSVHGRRLQVAAEVTRTTDTTIAIVEIQGRAAFEAGADPKPPLRLGLADGGRLSQFITPVEDSSGGSLPHRARSAWVDGLRQVCGRLTPLRPRVQGVTLPDPVDHVAVWVVRHNATRSSGWDKHRLPVAVWTSSDGHVVWARALGMPEWKPYALVLLEVATRASFGEPPECDEASVTGFVDQVLHEVAGDRPVLLLTCAQNLRDGWKWLANSRMTIDRLGFRERVLPIQEFPGVRHVRVRLGADHETPECYGITDEDAVGLSGGLWRIPGCARTFASTAQRPDSARSHSKPSGSRIAAWTTGSAPVVEDHRAAWNPGLVELTAAALQDGDDPVTWVALAHAMRRLSETYRDDLTLPVPLHLAYQIGEYAMPITEEADASDDDSHS